MRIRALFVILLLLLCIFPVQAERNTRLVASDFTGEQWKIEISEGFLTFLSSNGERFHPVAVKPGFEKLAKSRLATGEKLPVPDGMADEYLLLLDDSLTGGAVCSNICVNRSEIVMLLALPHGKTRLRIAEWNDNVKFYAFLDNDTVPVKSWFDIIHYGDGEINLHWLANEEKLSPPIESIAGTEHNAVIKKDRHGTWWVRTITAFGQKDVSYTLGWNYIVNNDLRKFGSNEGFLLGDYVWNYVEYIDFGGLRLEQDALKAKFEQTSTQWAVVSNPDPDDRLHLRTGPDMNLESLGKFYNRTPVLVLESIGDWSHVIIGSENLLEGWMMNKYLAFDEDKDKVACAFPSRRGLVFKNESIAHPVYVSPSLDAPSTWEAKGGPNEFIIGVYEDQWLIVMNDEGQTGYILAKWYREGNG